METTIVILSLASLALCFVIVFMSVSLWYYQSTSKLWKEGYEEEKKSFDRMAGLAQKALDDWKKSTASYKATIENQNKIIETYQKMLALNPDKQEPRQGSQ